MELEGKERRIFYPSKDYTCLGHAQLYRSMDSDLSAAYSGISPSSGEGREMTLQGPLKSPTWL